MEVREREEKEKTVMTEEQMEILRRQISVYSFICELLVDMHKSFTSHNPSLSGMKLGNMYCDPLMASGGLNISARHRWAPTPVQLQVLESIFSQGNGAPGKKKIKEITSELTQHGPISETNVYNWFQNRRSRSKRKQQQQFTNNVDSEVETEAESPKEKKAKVETMLSHENPTPRADDQFFRSLGRGSEVYSLDPWPSEAQVAFPPNNGSRSSGGMVTYLSTRACCRPKYAPAHEELYDPFARDMLGVIGPHVCTTCAHALLIKNNLCPCSINQEQLVPMLY